MNPLTRMYTKQLTFLNMTLPKAYNLKYFLTRIYFEVQFSYKRNV